MKIVRIKVKDLKHETEKEYRHIKNFADEVGANSAYISKMTIRNNGIFIYKYRYRIERISDGE